MSSGVYFIRSGTAEVLAQHGTDAKVTADLDVVAQIGDGCYFGEASELGCSFAYRLPLPARGLWPPATATLMRRVFAGRGARDPSA